MTSFNQKKIRNELYTLALACFVSISLLTFEGFENSASPITVFLFLLGIYLIIHKAILLPYDRIRNILVVIFAALLSGTLVVGAKIDLWKSPGFSSFAPKDIVFWLGLCVILYFTIMLLTDFAVKREFSLCCRKQKKTFFLIVFAVICSAWLPYFLIFYPGILSSDSFSHVNQFLGITPLNNHHPVLYTLIVELFMSIGMRFGNITVGVACFSLFQLITVAAGLSYFVYWLSSKGAPKFVIGLTIVFFAFNPVIATYSITMWKDIFFAVWMLLLMLFLYDTIESGGELICTACGSARFAILSTLVSFARNNGRYVIFVLLMLLIIVYRKRIKRVLPLSLSILTFVFVIQGPVYGALHIKQSNFAESVGIPIQQIGFTVANGGIVTEEQKAILDQIMPLDKWGEKYVNWSPDSIKFDPDFNNEYLNENKGKFIKIWASMLPNNFIKYVKAYLMQTIGYYHIGTTNWVFYPGDAVYEQNIQKSDLLGKLFGQEFAPSVQKMTEKLIDAPIISAVFSISTMFWMTLALCIVLIVKRRSKYILTVIPLLLLWGTLMVAAPTFCEFRYMYSFHLALPLVLFMMFAKQGNFLSSEEKQYG